MKTTSFIEEQLILNIHNLKYLKLVTDTETLVLNYQKKIIVRLQVVRSSLDSSCKLFDYLAIKKN